MSHTPYDSPDDAKDRISIDITYETVWFFQHSKNGEEIDDLPVVTVHIDELPAIVKALQDYLAE